VRPSNSVTNLESFVALVSSVIGAKDATRSISMLRAVTLERGGRFFCGLVSSQRQDVGRSQAERRQCSPFLFRKQIQLASQRVLLKKRIGVWFSPEDSPDDFGWRRIRFFDHCI
jgi:hypothetical protein